MSANADKRRARVHVRVHVRTARLGLAMDLGDSQVTQKLTRFCRDRQEIKYVFGRRRAQTDVTAGCFEFGEVFRLTRGLMMRRSGRKSCLQLHVSNLD